MAESGASAPTGEKVVADAPNDDDGAVKLFIGQVRRREAPAAPPLPLVLHGSSAPPSGPERRASAQTVAGGDNLRPRPHPPPPQCRVLV